jgi:hypothetical protein
MDCTDAGQYLVVQTIPVLLWCLPCPQERIEGVLGPDVARLVTAGTFHSICCRLLRYEAGEQPINWVGGCCLGTALVERGAEATVNLQQWIRCLQGCDMYHTLPLPQASVLWEYRHWCPSWCLSICRQGVQHLNIPGLNSNFT